MRQPLVVRTEQVAALGSGYVSRERAPRLGEDRLDSVEEPVDLALPAKEDAAQDEREAAFGMVLGIRERERRSPRAAEDDPLVDAQVLAQALQVLDQFRRGVVLEAAQRRRAARATLVVDDDLI